MLNLDAFGPWAEWGYAADLLLIIPPAAPLSPYSRLTPDHCGKTPGIPTPDGWTGFPHWPQHETTPAELEQWLRVLNGAPYNIGMNARRIHAIDVDTRDRAFGRAAFDTIWQHMPDACERFGVRVGRAPGFLIPFVPDQPRRKQRILFKDEKGSKAAVEILGVGQQFVIGGQHPCGARYLWHGIDTGVSYDQLMNGLPPASWGASH